MSPEVRYSDRIQAAGRELLAAGSCHERAAVARSVVRLCLEVEESLPEGVIRLVWARRREQWAHRARWWARRARGGSM